jgi:hypothetical protein
VKPVPFTVQDIVDHADELAERFESYERRPTDERDPVAFVALREAAEGRSEAARTVREAGADVRAGG